jgi:hypothetical protein
MNYSSNYHNQQEHQNQSRNRDKLKLMLIRQHFNNIVVKDINNVELKVEIKDIIPFKNLHLNKKIYRKYYIILKDGETIQKQKINFNEKEFVKELIAYINHGFS